MQNAKQNNDELYHKKPDGIFRRIFVCLLTILRSCFIIRISQCKRCFMEKWSKQKAYAWYNAQPWIRGFNGLPSNCVNRIAMWQSYGHDKILEQLKYEYALAKQTGFNAVRLVGSFEVWLYQHDSYMAILEEYIALAAQNGLNVMYVIGNDCSVPKALYGVTFGEQKVDWGYHSGIKRGQHSGLHNEHGYLLADDKSQEFFAMVDELAKKYGQDSRLHIWDVWNEVGGGKRKTLSVPLMERCFEILRQNNVSQPLTADVWSYDENLMPHTEEEKRALELSDIITFHYYGSYQNMVKLIENLREIYDRPLINNEWLHRITHNNVDEIFPLFYLEQVGSYHWGLMQGFSQTYEPWGYYMDDIANPAYCGGNDYSKWQHDLFRFNGLPYIAKEIEIIKDFSARADKKFYKKQ